MNSLLNFVHAKVVWLHMAGDVARRVAWAGMIFPPERGVYPFSTNRDILPQLPVPERNFIIHSGLSQVRSLMSEDCSFQQAKEKFGVRVPTFKTLT
jgi:hypothetical protein